MNLLQPITNEQARDIARSLTDGFREYGLECRSEGNETFYFLADWFPNKHLKLVMPVGMDEPGIYHFLRKRIVEGFSKELPLIDELHKKYVRLLQEQREHYNTLYKDQEKRIRALERALVAFTGSGNDDDLDDW